jgi:putative hydrolase of the HAD superfamily
MEIKSVVFDFGGVILNIDFNKTAEAFASLGVDRFIEMYSQKNADHLFRHYEEGKLSEPEFYDAIRRSINNTLSDEQIRHAWNALLLDYRIKAIDTLKKIRPHYNLYLLSNTNSIHVAAFTKIYHEQFGGGNLEDHFDKIYYSHIIGLRKPAKEAYEYVLKENNLIAAETLFVDDTEPNIPPAKELGMQTVLLEKGMGIEDIGLIR